MAEVPFSQISTASEPEASTNAYEALTNNRIRHRQHRRTPLEFSFRLHPIPLRPKLCRRLYRSIAGLGIFSEADSFELGQLAEEVEVLGFRWQGDRREFLAVGQGREIGEFLAVAQPERFQWEPAERRQVSHFRSAQAEEVEF